MQTEQEIQNIKDLVIKTSQVEGDCIEVGVFKGSSALVIADNLSKGKHLFLYDTFEGLKDISKYDPTCIVHCEFSVSEENVRSIFADNKNVTIHRGFFPHDKETQFEGKLSFVHLDADTYLSTLVSLWYVYDKMTVGGIILLHDYNGGGTTVKRAADLFLRDKPEKIVLLDTTQAYIIKK